MQGAAFAGPSTNSRRALRRIDEHVLIASKGLVQTMSKVCHPQHVDQRELSWTVSSPLETRCQVCCRSCARQSIGVASGLASCEYADATPLLLWFQWSACVLLLSCSVVSERRHRTIFARVTSMNAPGCNGICAMNPCVGSLG